MEEEVPPLAPRAKIPGMLTLYQRDLAFLPDGVLKECLLIPIKVACKHCAQFPVLWPFVMDFIQEGNRQVMEAIEHTEWDKERMKSYIARSAKGAMYQYLARTFDIYLSPSVRYRMLRRNDEQELAHLDLLEHHTSWEALLEHKVQIADTTTIQAAFNRAKRQKIEGLLTILPTKEREAVEHYYGIDEHAQSSTEIAERFALSRDHTKRLINVALKRMRQEQVQPSREWIDEDRPRRLQTIYEAHQGAIGVCELAKLAKVHTRIVSKWLKEQRSCT